MITDFQPTADDYRTAELEAAADIIREFQDDPFLLRALMRCAPMLVAAQASDSACPTAQVGEAMHELRREAFALLRVIVDEPTPRPPRRQPCPKCHGPCDPDWGCDSNL